MINPISASYNFIISFLVTIFLESIVYIIGIRQKVGKVVLYCILINLFTIPLANIFTTTIVSFFIVEALVFLVETFLIFKLFENKLWKAFVISFIANLISMMAGIIMMTGIQFLLF